MTLPRLEVSPRLRELMTYDKFAGDAPRLMVLESGYWLDIACINAARRMGWEVRNVPVALEGVMPRENVSRLLRTLVEFKPDFLLTINLGGMDVQGMFAGLFDDLRVPFVAWFVDDPRTILQGSTAFAGDWSVAFTWEERYASYLTTVGYPVAQTLPLAVDDLVFDAAPADTWDQPPTFVGNSNTASVDYELGYFADKPEVLRALLDVMESQQLTRESFAEGLEAMLGAEVIRTWDLDVRRHAELFLFVAGTRKMRIALARTLVPEGLQLRGDDEWTRLFPSAGHGSVNYLKELPAYYRACELNVNITSLQMATAVNQRVFDCPAAGGFLLTDNQPTLHTLFEVPREIIAYSSMEECRDLFRFYRAHPDSEAGDHGTGANAYPGRAHLPAPPADHCDDPEGSLWRSIARDSILPALEALFEERFQCFQTMLQRMARPNPALSALHNRNAVRRMLQVILRLIFQLVERCVAHHFIGLE